MASITKRGNAYLIRCYAGYTAEGKQITKVMTWHPEPGMLESRAQKEAQRQAVMFEDSIKFGICDNTHIKFQQYTEIWLKDYAEVELAPKTVYDYKHLMPAINAEIGYLYLDKITPTHLIRLRDKLSQAKKETRYTVRGNLKQMLKARGFRTYVALQKASGLCEETIHRAAVGEQLTEATATRIADAMQMPMEDVFDAHEGKVRMNTTVRHYMRLISSMFTTAVQWKYLTDNPAARVGLPKMDSAEQIVLSLEEAQTMLELLEKEPIHHRTAITVLLLTGMRREEVMGLRWRHLDFTDNLISIEKAIQYVPGMGNIEGETKTRQSRRVVKAAPMVMDCLHTFQNYKRKQMAEKGLELSNNDYVFGKANGKTPVPGTLTSWFKTFIRRNNLPDIHLHDLRHTAATLMIEEQCPITAVAGTLGHATPATTTAIYAHALQRASAKTATVMQNLFEKKEIS